MFSKNERGAPRKPHHKRKMERVVSYQEEDLADDFRTVAAIKGMSTSTLIRHFACTIVRDMQEEIKDYCRA